MIRRVDARPPAMFQRKDPVHEVVIGALTHRNPTRSSLFSFACYLWAFHHMLGIDAIPLAIQEAIQTALDHDKGDIREQRQDSTPDIS